MALVAELNIGSSRLVIYDLHLESKGDDDLRLWQLSEVVLDSSRYPYDTPLVVAGDFNTRNIPSPLRDYLLMTGFRDACDGIQRPGTKRNGQRLDWIFVRGPVVCSGTRVHQDAKASDHFPLSTNLTLNV
jgi:endonuclease/exonuclease/phosphatase family metal-dependent hydrolase